jgi:hypothetical protein
VSALTLLNGIILPLTLISIEKTPCLGRQSKSTPAADALYNYVYHANN